MAHRLAVLTDWQAGFVLDAMAEPLEEIPPGGTYEIESAPQTTVMLEQISVRHFAIARAFIERDGGKLDEIELAIRGDGGHRGPDVTIYEVRSFDRRVHPSESIHLLLRNDSDAPQRPLVAAIIRVPDVPTPR